MNVLVTGACGLLGSHVVARLARKHDVAGIDRNAWWGDQPAHILQGDLSDPEYLRNTIADQPHDVIVHCAAMVDVDACEQNPAAAHRVNVEVTRNLLSAIAADKCLFVYISTDSVFDGEAPYSAEDRSPNPRNAYARGKLEGECLVRELAKDYLIVRTNFYGWSSGRKKTSGEWLFRSLREGAAVTLFEDFFFTPMYVVDFVRYLELLIDRGCTGLFHVAGRDRLSKYDFGKLMAESLNVPMTNVVRSSLSKAQMPAPRPRDISLNTDRIRSVIGQEMPGCADGLRRFLEDHSVSLSRRVARTA